jgi:hypothetical protein
MHSKPSLDGQHPIILRLECDAPAASGDRRFGKTHKPGIGGVDRDAIGVSSASSKRELKEDSEDVLI